MVFLSRIAVLLAAYNGERWIEEQIKTILSQDGVCLDLYISLDLSTDNSLNIITKLIEQYHNIKLLPYGQKFGSAAPNFYYLLLNVPIENYDYIALSDQDDIWFKNKLQKAINLLEAEDSFGYSGNVTAFWEDGRKKIIKKSYSQCKYDYLFESPGPGCSFVLKNELAILVREYIKLTPSMYGLDWHDWIIYAFARKNNFKWIIDHNSYTLYRQHEKNQFGANVGYVAFIRRVKDIISGYGINQTVAVIKFLGIENDKFVTKWYINEKVRYLTLSLHANECRRRWRDKFLFFVACILMSIKKPRIIELRII